MKKYFSLIIALVAISAVSCDKIDEIFSSPIVEREFNAILGDNTRTSVDAEGNVAWEAGDVIKYYTAKNGEVKSATVPTSGNSATIRVQMEENASFFIAEYGGSGITDNTSGNTFTINGAVNATQTGLFKDAHVAIAKTYLDDGTEYRNLNFKNITSIIKFTLERSDVAKIVFTAANGEKIHGNGTVKINFSGTDATPSFGDDGGSSITVNTNGAGTFYIATLPVNLSKGFTISCYDSSESLLGSVTGSKAMNIKKNDIVNLGSLDSRIAIHYSLLDVYEDSNNGKGIIYWISDDQTRALAISTNEIFGMNWGNSLNWCHTYGDGQWDMPTIDELDLAAQRFTEINTQLDAISAAKLNDGNFCYWSKTENDNDSEYAYRERLRDRLVLNYGNDERKSSTRNYTRAIIRIGHTESTIPVTSISLNDIDLTFSNFNATYYLTATISPSDATNKNVTWTSSNISVATVDQDGKVTAVGYGNATITATNADGGISTTCSVTVFALNEGAVNLGLSVKWASANVGASQPEEYGDYYAWGEISTKSEYNWSTYKWCNGANNSITKYCDNPSYGYNEFTDNKQTLDANDDAAHISMGGCWRMPTRTECEELCTQCTWKWTKLNNVNGRLVTGPNGNSIFLPAAGDRDGTLLTHIGSRGYYWSSSLQSSHPIAAYNIFFDSDTVCMRFPVRDYGRSVRPIYDPNYVAVTSITLNKSESILYAGETILLSAVVLPAEATDKTLFWQSSDQSVATVTAEGLVRAIGAGSATITASTGGLSSTCQITVKSVDSNIIQFADPEVKAICVANWDTNKDGELSYGEAATVQDLGTTFRAKTTIVSFNELEYFSGLTSIASNAFESCIRLSNIKLPSTINAIMPYAFKGCSKLSSITIPSSVNHINEYAFYSCTSLTSIIIPEGCNSIGWGAFEDCSRLTSITISEGVSSIGTYSFRNCSSLTSIIIPEGCNSIGSGAFEDCSSLNSITISEGVSNIGSYAFYNCPNLSSIALQGVTVIDDSAFGNCTSITTIVIPKGVLSIGSGVFEGCTNLTSISIPEGVTSIGGHTFYDCSHLTSITIPEGVTSIENGLFYNCTSLTSISIPEGVTSIKEDAFYNCSSLSSITIPQEVTRIEIRAFQNCSSLTSIVIPEWVSSIEESTFEGCKSLTNVTIPQGVTSIGIYAFRDCSSLTTVIIPNGVTKIEEKTFEGCKSLANVTISQGTTSIGSYAFHDCSSLTSVYLPDGITCINEGTFYNCSNLTSITIPDGVTRIEDKAFEECKSLTNATIPQEVTSIGNRVFYNCSNLTSAVIPEGVTSIGSSLFYNCSSLTSVIIPNGVTKIGQLAFCNCSSLMSINIPEGITMINKSTFNGCSSLTQITIPQSVTSIGDYAFKGCSGVLSFTIPENVTSIGIDAFRNCSSLTSITIKPVIPPQLTRSPFDYDFNGATYPIYVPSSSVDAYKTAERWSDYASRIQGKEF